MVAAHQLVASVLVDLGGVHLSAMLGEMPAQPLRVVPQPGGGRAEAVDGSILAPAALRRQCGDPLQVAKVELGGAVVSEGQLGEADHVEDTGVRLAAANLVVGRHRRLLQDGTVQADPVQQEQDPQPVLGVDIGDVAELVAHHRPGRRGQLWRQTERVVDAAAPRFRLTPSFIRQTSR